LWLPQADEPPAAAVAAAEAREAEVPGGAAGILLCDDDDEVRRFIGEFLASLGYDVAVANDGGEALRLLERRGDIDLLIVDYAMPGINGLETIRRARQRLPGLKPLLITGYASGVSGNTVGISLLRKPFAPADLAQRVAEILAA
jgi:CheY-like chemotaxis protein